MPERENIYELLNLFFVNRLNSLFLRIQILALDLHENNYFVNKQIIVKMPYITYI